VEAPNGQLFLHPDHLVSERVSQPLAALSTPTCSGCGECQRFCAFNAILAVGDKVLVFPELCHACGGCMRVCPEGVLVEVPRETGSVTMGRAQQVTFLAGRLDVGEPRAAPVIEAVLAAAPRTGVVVVDAPPGTSCSAVAAVRDADHVVLVTEPTPFGLHDLELAVEMCRSVGARLSAVINRSDLGGAPVRSYLRHEAIPVVAEIPFDRTISTAYAAGELAARQSNPLRWELTRLAKAVLTQREEAA